MALIHSETFPSMVDAISLKISDNDSAHEFSGRLKCYRHVAKIFSENRVADKQNREFYYLRKPIPVSRKT